MSDEPMTPAFHPEEQLAAYVGGSAAPEERALVEQHLVMCAACRSDIKLAREARLALRTLPTLEAPRIVATLHLPGGEATTEVISLDAKRSRMRWQRVTVALGAAAAASIVAVALVLHLGAGGGPSPVAALSSAEKSGGLQDGAASSGATGDYTQQSLAALATQLQGSSEYQRHAIPGTSSPVASPASALDRTALAAGGSACLQGAAGLPSRAPLSFFQVGSFEGTPAYIGVFRTGTGDQARLIVVAATRDGCRALDVISARL